MSENIKKYFKSYKFWLSLSSALFLVLENVLKHFNINLNEEDFMFVVNIILGFFVFLGIISYPSNEEEKNEANEELQKNSAESNKNSKNETK